jgi:tRNA A-37 threonylcarbamoyl transferase component Bud32
MARARSGSGAESPCPTCGEIPRPSDGPVRFCPRCGARLREGRARVEGPLAREIVADRYRLLELLGEGGMGTVYKAEHVRMGKVLALKVLRRDQATGEGAAERFLAEARVVSRLSHPHTIAVFDFGELPRGGFYLAMEYVEGRDLAALLRDEGPVGEGRAAGIGRQVLGALAEAHAAGIVHRDLKPANVVRLETGSDEDFVKVLDFGVAALGGERLPGERAGLVVGTPSYVAPEQARGEAVDARADLYGVGCVLFELVAGRPPFVAAEPAELLRAHVSEPPPDLGALAPGTSPRFAAVVARALAKRPADRFASAEEMRDALDGIATRPSPVPVPAGPGREDDATGGLEIAQRADFDALERQVRVLRRGRTGPIVVAAAIAAAAAAAWRWPDLYALATARAPMLAARVPDALRPDGVEHEPNDTPDTANPLAIPPGPRGGVEGGVARVTGHVGARIDAHTGDVDLFRIDVPPSAGRRTLVARWHAEGGAGGIEGLDVALTLHRAPDAGGGTAPLVATASGAGRGAPERLEATVSPGRYWLGVREQHEEGSAPVEKPSDRYVLEVTLEPVKAR